MNARQTRFVQGYLLNGGNATQAAEYAGYSKKTAKVQGSRLLTYADVREAIEKGQEQAQERFERSHGSILKDIEDIGSEARAAAAFAPALKAKELIGRHFGMWPTRVELAGRDGKPIEIEQKATIDFASLDSEAREAIRAALQAAKAK